jgi:hypothetical protein
MSTSADWLVPKGETKACTAPPGGGALIAVLARKGVVPRDADGAPRQRREVKADRPALR